MEILTVDAIRANERHYIIEINGIVSFFPLFFFFFCFLSSLSPLPSPLSPLPSRSSSHSHSHSLF